MKTWELDKIMSQEQEQQIPQTSQSIVRICAQCRKPADKRYIEKLPNNGTLYLSMHHDGSEPCRLGEFIAREKPTRKHKKQHKIVTCPECGETGNLWTAGAATLKPGRPEHERGLWITYEVVHGKGHKERHRHRINDPAQRANLLEQLGRLLDKSMLTEIKKKRGPGRPPKSTNKKQKVQSMIAVTPSPGQSQHQNQLQNYREEIKNQCSHLLEMWCQNGNGHMDCLEIARRLVRITDVIKI